MISLCTYCQYPPAVATGVNLQTWIAIAGLLATLLTIYAIVWVNRRGSRDNLLATLVTAFSNAKKLQGDALSAEDDLAAKALAAAYFDALIDLHWMEFQLWKRKSVENAPFWTWTQARRVMHKENAAVTGVTFQERWERFKKVNGDFVGSYARLMDRVFKAENDGIVAALETANKGRSWSMARNLRYEDGSEPET